MDRRLDAVLPKSGADVVATWAPGAGFDYVDVDNSLIGLWFPPHDGPEDYRFVARGVSNGRDVIVCVREHYTDASGLLRAAIIAVRLPGTPPPEFLGGAADNTLRKMGGAVPSGYQLEATANGWLLARKGGYHSARLTADIDLLTIQVGMAPAGFWR